METDSKNRMNDLEQVSSGVGDIEVPFVELYCPEDGCVLARVSILEVPPTCYCPICQADVRPGVRRIFD